MRGWSFPVGRVLGVEVRMHAFFAAALAYLVGNSVYNGESGARGVVLWCLILFAVLVRESARAVGAACLGMELRSLVLLPVGGLPTYTTPEGVEAAKVPLFQGGLAFVGPVANLVCGAVLGGILLAVSPGIAMWGRPWVMPGHLLQAAVWTNVLLGVVNLLPAALLDGGRVMRNSMGTVAQTLPGIRKMLNVGQVVSVAIVVTGMVLSGPWFFVIGFTLLFGARMEDQGLPLHTDVDAITLRDIMLVDYTTLSASDTLEDALDRAVHTMQDVFPVVRGGTIVGAVSRQRVLEALESGGNSYVQGVMARTFEVARPEDTLVHTLKRMAGTAIAQFVPVVEGQRVIGIVTPHHLSQSIRLRGHLRRRVRTRDAG